MALVKVAQMDK